MRSTEGEAVKRRSTYRDDAIMRSQSQRWFRIEPFCRRWNLSEKSGL